MDDTWITLQIVMPEGVMDLHLSKVEALGLMHEISQRLYGEEQ